MCKLISLHRASTRRQFLFPFTLPLPSHCLGIEWNARAVAEVYNFMPDACRN